MGVNPTPTNFKTFTFDGENSRAYGVYITGEGVFNAPERNVEMVDIPGRNGAFALDKGNFNNIEVTYPAGIFADTEADFAQAVSDLRNLLCSKVGYVRLEDDYNPNEYRLAIYKSGLDVSHDLLIAGEFELVFECKPQRYLKSGETAISVTSGNTITNPTRFDAKPLLMLWGYGEVDISGATVNVDNVVMGWVEVAPSKTETGYFLRSTVQNDVLNVGDSISIERKSVDISSQYSSGVVTNVSVTSTTDCSASAMQSGTNGFSVSISLQNISFINGTSETKTAFCHVSWKLGGVTKGYTVTITAQYSGSDGILHYVSIVDDQLGVATSDTVSVSVSRTMGDSSKSILGNPLYIDLDVGEAWNEDYAEPVSLNYTVQLPANLPVLASGANTITYDNTYTQVKIVPRWWSV